MGARLLQRQRAILGPGGGEIGRSLRPFDHAVQRVIGPLRIGLVQKGQIQQPFARVIDDIQMHGLRAEDAGQKPRGLHPERQSKLRHRPRAVGPMRIVAGQRGQMAFEVETRDGVVGLGLQIGGLDPPRGLCLQLRHPRPVQQVCDQPGDEHRLARARQAGDAQPDHRVAERFGHGRDQPFQTAPQLFGQVTDRHGFLPARLCSAPQDRHRAAIV